MTLSIRRYTVLAVALLSMLAMSASAAFAQYPPASAFGVSCTDVAPGQTAQCSVVGAQPGEVLSVTASADGQVFDTQSVTADADGNASFSVAIPTNVLGNVVITVEGPLSGTASDTITVAAAPGTGTGTAPGTPVAGAALPMTGGEVGVLLLVALTLLGFGLLAVRRREDSKVAVDA